MPPTLQCAARQVTNGRFPPTNPRAHPTGSGARTARRRCTLKKPWPHRALRHFRAAVPEAGPRAVAERLRASPGAAPAPRHRRRRRRRRDAPAVRGRRRRRARDRADPRAHGLHVVRAAAAHGRALDRVRLVAPPPDDGGAGHHGRRRRSRRRSGASSASLYGVVALHVPELRLHMPPTAPMPDRHALRALRRPQRADVLRSLGARVRLPVRGRGGARARPRGAAAPERGGAHAACARTSSRTSCSTRSTPSRGSSPRSRARRGACSCASATCCATRCEEQSEMQPLDEQIAWLRRYAQILEARHRGALRFEWDVARGLRAGDAAAAAPAAARRERREARGAAARRRRRARSSVRVVARRRRGARVRRRGQRPGHAGRGRARRARSGCRRCAGGSSSRRRTASLRLESSPRGDALDRRDCRDAARRTER